MQNLFGFVIYPMELGLVWLALAVGSAGIGIILFTIFVRCILAPLQIVQLRNAKAMQRLQPLMAEMRKKHGQDREAMSRATMELYKEHGVNPAMGCLPMVIQLPILFGLFYALMHLGTAPSGWPGAIEWAKSGCNGHTVGTFSAWYHYCYGVKNMPGTPSHVWALFHAQFLWLRNGLGRPDPFYILPLLAGLTQWIQSRMMLTQSSDPQQQMMNTMMNFMPLFIIFFATRYASGLSLYWVTSTTIGILIQYKITGWGMLPVPWARGASATTARAPAPKPKAKPKPSTLVPPPTETTTDGGNGASESDSSNGKSESTRGTRPRKKANRASRGGRGGGRRG